MCSPLGFGGGTPPGRVCGEGEALGKVDVSKVGFVGKSRALGVSCLSSQVLLYAQQGRQHVTAPRSLTDSLEQRRRGQCCYAMAVRGTVTAWETAGGAGSWEMLTWMQISAWQCWQPLGCH